MHLEIVCAPVALVYADHFAGGKTSMACCHKCPYSSAKSFIRPRAHTWKLHITTWKELRCPHLHHIVAALPQFAKFCRPVTCEAVVLCAMEPRTS